jgi:hypothetical protein
MTDKKLTFSEARGQINAARNNSDLHNLAHAAEAIEQRRKELAKLDKEVADMAAAIESGDFPDVTDLRKLYERAHGHRV